MQYQKFDWCLWYKLVGRDGEEPYVDEVKDLNRQTLARVYINACLFPSWKDFQEQALIGVKTHLLNEHPVKGRSELIRRPGAKPLSPQDPFLLEWTGGDWNIWVNVASTRNEADFVCTVAKARLTIEAYEKERKRLGSEALARQNVPFKEPQYPTANNHRDDIIKFCEAFCGIK